MPRHITNRLKFLLERLVLRGAHYRLLIIAALIGLLSVLAGSIIHFAGAAVDGGLSGAIWWAFLRLSDPGYLGDDEGTLRRIVSTILTVLGYVVFLGALVAIMTQWLHERMRELEAGLTPIAQRDHVLILGWTNRTPTIVQELVMAGPRVRRFLQLHGARTLRIAILAEAVTTALSLELKERLGRRWNERQVILRTGSPLRVEHLRRVDFPHASAVIMPATDLGGHGADHADSRAIKTLLSITNHPQAQEVELPLVVAEILDSRRVEVARRAYGGPIEILASDAIVSRLIAQSVRHRGLSDVYGELLTHGRGNEIYVRSSGELAGREYGELPGLFDEAVLLGIVRPEGDSFCPLLNPDGATVVQPDDRLALVARTYDSAAPSTTPSRKPRPRAAHPPLRAGPASRPRRVLLLGWNHKVPALLQEFDSYANEQFEVEIISTVPVSRRRSQLQRQDTRADRVVVRHVEADFATSSALEQADVASFDNIVLLGSDRFESGEESDARSILGYLLLRDVLPQRDRPALLIELLDAGNVGLFRGLTGEVIISSVLVSHMLAQVALRRELRAVFDELFGPGGAEIVFRAAADYDLAGVTASFADVELAAAARGETALGVRVAGGARQRGGGLLLNPPRAQQWSFGSDDQVVALTTS
jgi:ion channel POLLUX/CASTOR